MLNVVLFEPEIPSNTGNIGRTCVVTGARLHLIRPYGFALTDPLLKRAGMNYWHNLDVAEYDGWDDFLARNPGARLHLLTKRGARTYAQATYRDGDFLVFGKESTGIPRAILDENPALCERIPMLPDAVALDDAPQWRARHDALVAGAPDPTGTHTDICGNFVAETPGTTGTAGVGTDATGAADQGTAAGQGDRAGISSLNLSNSVAIVLYEALRQIGFPGMEA